MSRPPRQPGQPYGWGRQPGGQYPTSGQQQAWPQQQWSQQPGQAWPQQAWPGQQHPYGHPPPTGDESKLPWILGGTGGGVLLLAIVVAPVLVFTGSGPRAAAEKFAKAVEEQDISTIRGMLCSEPTDEYSAVLQKYAPQARNRWTQSR